MLLIQPFFMTDSVQHLPEVEVAAHAKQFSAYKKEAISATTLSMQELENRRIEEPKDMSIIIPNLYIPDYGSKMTSSIYVRGMGARIDQPAMGLYVDNVPILNKNNYDFDLFDIRRIDVLRGAQGTLYGRNTMGGIIDIHTLSPLNYEGTRMRAEYGNGNTANLHLAVYRHSTEKSGYSFAMNHHQSDGFYTNEYNGEKCDRIISDGARFRLQRRFSNGWMLDNTVSGSIVRQDGFAYAQLIENGKLKIENGSSPSSNFQVENGNNPSGNSQLSTFNFQLSHNDPCNYSRRSFIDGLSLLWRNERLQFLSTTSYQLMDDEMNLDQDFTPRSMFTLKQAQTENAFTQELVLKNTEVLRRWHWLIGAFGFYKHVDMNAPVTFKRDGIDELILANANNGIHTFLPDADLLIEEDEFLINSRFKMPAYGASLYHQSAFELNRWTLTVGIRFDYEHTGIHYYNDAVLHYRFTANQNPYRPLYSQMADEAARDYLETMPKLSALYQWKNGNIYASIARGYKAGGFNTQIFSDILQNKLMNDMMEDLGVHFDNMQSQPYNPQNAISYQPEYSWNYEAGSRLNLNNHFFADIALFYIDCRNQQLTVFPAGKTTGRLMSNAGHTRSFGSELSLKYHYKELNLTANYGYTNARFVAYNDGNNDYADRFVPYVPQNTVYVSANYGIPFQNNKYIDRFICQADYQLAGKIYWNESNSLSQDVYGLLGASLSWQKNNLIISLWGKFLTNEEYSTFYFKSVGNSFVQRAKPLQAGISLKLNIN